MTPSDDQKLKDTAEAASLAGVSCAAPAGSVMVARLEYAWQIHRKNSLDIVRHTLRSASEPPLHYHEQIIGEMCEALSQNA